VLIDRQLSSNWVNASFSESGASFTLNLFAAYNSVRNSIPGVHKSIAKKCIFIWVCWKFRM